MQKTFTERLYCHNCDTTQSFTWDLELEGRQVFYCPNCNHEHYRLLKEDERMRMAIMPKRLLSWTDEAAMCESIDIVTVPMKHISDERWGSANRPHN